MDSDQYDESRRKFKVQNSLKKIRHNSRRNQFKYKQLLTEPDLDIDSNIDIRPKVMKDVACGDEPDQID